MSPAVNIVGHGLIAAGPASLGVPAAEGGHVVPAPGAQRQGDSLWLSARPRPAPHNCGTRPGLQRALPQPRWRPAGRADRSAPPARRQPNSSLGAGPRARRKRARLSQAPPRRSHQTDRGHQQVPSLRPTALSSPSSVPSSTTSRSALLMAADQAQAPPGSGRPWTPSSASMCR